MNDYKQKRLEEFDEKFPCIETECNNNGSMTGYDREGDAEQQQCQYCFEHRLPQKDFLAETIEQAVSEEKERVKGWIKAEKATYSEDVAQRERAVYDHIIKCFGEFSSQDKPLDK